MEEDRSYSNRFRVAIFAPDSRYSAELEESAESLGQAVALSNGIIFIEARAGLSLVVARAGKEQEGLVVGFSPARDLIEHELVYGLPRDPYALIFTGAGGQGINPLLISNCEIAVFVGGGSMVLSAFALAWSQLNQQRAIVLLRGSGGIADDVLPGLIDHLSHWEPAKARLFTGKRPVTLIEKAIEYVGVMREQF